MRQFYLSFSNWNTVCSELSWSHYRTLIKIEEQHIREFYMEEAIKGNWSVRQLERQIATCSYSRVIANNSELEKIDNANETTAVIKYEPNTVIKDPYMLEFLGLDNNVNYLEKELEDALINHLQKFLLELGRGFCFVARQKRLTFDNEHYFIDLVFYNAILKCYVVIDLKTDKLSHEALGQIDLYRSYYDHEIKMPDDNPTIGLLVCSDMDRIDVQWSFKGISTPMGVATYNNIRIKDALPSQEQLAERVRLLQKELQETKRLMNKRKEI
jgi:predicted nuclease of restriction endonuclease-like (RecB) superfamily